LRSEFVRLMTHTLTIHKRERDWQGVFKDIKVTSDVKGFVQYGKKLVTDSKGEEVVSSATVFLRNDAPVDPRHEHWLIDQTAPYVRSNMEVIRIDPIDDPRTGETHHYEVAVR